jgi:hypothetical protein
MRWPHGRGNADVLLLIVTALVAVGLGCFAPVAVARLKLGLQAAPPAGDLMRQFRDAITSAAVRSRSLVVTLETLPAGERQVLVRFATQPPELDETHLTKRALWVTLPAQLRRFCDGNADKSLALTQALGLAPGGPPRGLYKISVATDRVFRPCSSRTTVSDGTCSASPGNPLPAPLASELADADREHFVLWQLMAAYQDSARGAPFTAMGWTYNWSPNAASPVGLTEFVILPGSAIESDAEPISAGAFCGLE